MGAFGGNAKVIDPIRIASGATMNFTIVVYDVTVTELDEEETRSRADLTGATVLFAVQNSTGTRVIEKTSAVPAQIEIAADQTAGSATRGTATLKFVGADTSALAPGKYSYDAWAIMADGRVDNIVDKSPFHVDPTCVDLP